MKLTDLTSYADAQSQFSMARLWDLFDGDRERLNISHECIDRHADDAGRIAVRLADADGGYRELSFAEIKRLSGRLAHWLVAQGVSPGDRVAFMLEPSPAFYAGLFGAMRMGAVAVPLFTLFGPDGLRLRLDDCKPKILLTTADKAGLTAGMPGLKTVVADEAFMAALEAYPSEFAPSTRADDMAMYQYTSGTTRELPEAVKHTHRAIVLVTIAALYGTGIRPGDRFFCPSSPAWGHGLWHGTLAPLGLGVATGAYAGRFDADRLMQALAHFRISNLSAAATHYRMMKNAGTAERYKFELGKLSYTGEPIDSETLAFVEKVFRIPVCSMYGTTEVGVCLVNYPGAADFTVKPGSLGKPPPGMVVEIHGPDGAPVPPGRIGEIKLRRGQGWIATKDLGHRDADGYFFHDGRADDVIISAGWTMSAVEIEDILLKHPDVREAAAIGVPDAVRGQVVKAFLVSPRTADAGFVAEIQEFVRSRLSQHEYPRQVAVVAELPKTPAGKVNRKVLRDREAAATTTSTEGA